MVKGVKANFWKGSSMDLESAMKMMGSFFEKDYGITGFL